MTVKKIEGEKDRKKVRMKRGIAVRQKMYSIKEM